MLYYTQIDTTTPYYFKHFIIGTVPSTITIWAGEDLFIHSKIRRAISGFWPFIVFSCNHIYKEDTVRDPLAIRAYNPNETRDYYIQNKGCKIYKPRHLKWKKRSNVQYQSNHALTGMKRFSTSRLVPQA